MLTSSEPSVRVHGVRLAAWQQHELLCLQHPLALGGGQHRFAFQPLEGELTRHAVLGQRQSPKLPASDTGSCDAHQPIAVPPGVLCAAWRRP
jgi:hypothetical protein